MSAPTDAIIPLVPYIKRNSAFKYNINVSFVSIDETVGIRLSDEAGANYGGLANGDCLIFDAAQNVPQKVSFRMEWLGYNRMYHQQINVRTSSNVSTAITVRKLAQVVAFQFEQMKKGCIASGHGCSIPKWAFFPYGPIQNDNVILAGIKQVSQGTVEPIFYYRRA
ncbi:uncharacterized protein LAESUDRAFT_729078 [Laetiporus sulphureus 93-53]|uniref:Uncharacterized protein n=1 Tax=Laetiporus sulphureus 93-53 TaxID=1314785 RepID=A0A165CVI4_9APHY|nr:uncharacterized protein LAESUDRAFT_729078 [Laetiporus sulphureus 93-53]KZT03504.1 hypothetical protein LAESUDRAFT_729078 [Laetiporus sulphureus 93-53]